jgi:RNA polymerase sigma-70 factor (ECF subfamily)
MTARVAFDGLERSRLVGLAAQGDHDAFGRLAAAAIDRMHGVAWLILRDPHDAEDAVQEALVRAWRELPRLRDIDRFDAWLRRLLVNACHDVGRRHRRNQSMRLVELQVEPAGADGWRAVEDRDRLGRAFARLPIDQRTVLALTHYLGLTGPEVATAVGAPLGTVKSRLRYASAAMRAALEADDRVAEPARGQAT